MEDLYKDHISSLYLICPTIPPRLLYPDQWWEVIQRLCGLCHTIPYIPTEIQNSTLNQLEYLLLQFMQSNPSILAIRWIMNTYTLIHKYNPMSIGQLTIEMMNLLFKYTETDSSTVGMGINKAYNLYESDTNNGPDTSYLLDISSTQSEPLLPSNIVIVLYILQYLFHMELLETRSCIPGFIKCLPCLICHVDQSLRDATYECLTTVISVGIPGFSLADSILSLTIENLEKLVECDDITNMERNLECFLQILWQYPKLAEQKQLEILQCVIDICCTIYNDNIYLINYMNIIKSTIELCACCTVLANSPDSNKDIIYSINSLIEICNNSVFISGYGSLPVSGECFRIVFTGSVCRTLEIYLEKFNVSYKDLFKLWDIFILLIQKYYIQKHITQNINWLSNCHWVYLHTYIMKKLLKCIISSLIISIKKQDSHKSNVDPYLWNKGQIFEYIQGLLQPLINICPRIAIECIESLVMDDVLFWTADNEVLLALIKWIIRITSIENSETSVTTLIVGRNIGILISNAKPINFWTEFIFEKILQIHTLQNSKFSFDEVKEIFLHDTLILMGISNNTKCYVLCLNIISYLERIIENLTSKRFCTDADALEYYGIDEMVIWINIFALLDICLSNIFKFFEEGMIEEEIRDSVIDNITNSFSLKTHILSVIPILQEIFSSGAIEVLKTSIQSLNESTLTLKNRKFDDYNSWFNENDENPTLILFLSIKNTLCSISFSLNYLMSLRKFTEFLLLQRLCNDDVLSIDINKLKNILIEYSSLVFKEILPLIPLSWSLRFPNFDSNSFEVPFFQSQEHFLFPYIGQQNCISHNIHISTLIANMKMLVYSQVYEYMQSKKKDQDKSVLNLIRSPLVIENLMQDLIHSSITHIELEVPHSMLPGIKKSDLENLEFNFIGEMFYFSDRHFEWSEVSLEILNLRMVECMKKEFENSNVLKREHKDIEIKWRYKASKLLSYIILYKAGNKLIDEALEINKLLTKNLFKKTISHHVYWNQILLESEYSNLSSKLKLFSIFEDTDDVSISFLIAAKKCTDPVKDISILPILSILWVYRNIIEEFTIVDINDEINYIPLIFQMFTYLLRYLFGLKDKDKDEEVTTSNKFKPPRIKSCFIRCLCIHLICKLVELLKRSNGKYTCVNVQSKLNNLIAWSNYVTLQMNKSIDESDTLLDIYLLFGLLKSKVSYDNEIYHLSNVFLKDHFTRVVSDKHRAILLCTMANIPISNNSVFEKFLVSPTLEKNNLEFSPYVKLDKEFLNLLGEYLCISHNTSMKNSVAIYVFKNISVFLENQLKTLFDSYLDMNFYYCNLIICSSLSIILLSRIHEIIQIGDLNYFYIPTNCLWIYSKKVRRLIIQLWRFYLHYGKSVFFYTFKLEQHSSFGISNLICKLPSFVLLSFIILNSFYFINSLEILLDFSEGELCILYNCASDMIYAIINWLIKSRIKSEKSLVVLKSCIKLLDNKFCRSLIGNLISIMLIDCSFISKQNTDAMSNLYMGPRNFTLFEKLLNINSNSCNFIFPIYIQFMSFNMKINTFISCKSLKEYIFSQILTVLYEGLDNLQTSEKSKNKKLHILKVIPDNEKFDLHYSEDLNLLTFSRLSYFINNYKPCKKSMYDICPLTKVLQNYYKIFGYIYHYLNSHNIQSMIMDSLINEICVDQYDQKYIIQNSQWLKYKRVIFNTILKIFPYQDNKTKELVFLTLLSSIQNVANLTDQYKNLFHVYFLIYGTQLFIDLIKIELVSSDIYTSIIFCNAENLLNQIFTFFSFLIKFFKSFLVNHLGYRFAELKLEIIKCICKYGALIGLLKTKLKVNEVDLFKEIDKEFFNESILDLCIGNLIWNCSNASSYKSSFAKDQILYSMYLDHLRFIPSIIFVWLNCNFSNCWIQKLHKLIILCNDILHACNPNSHLFAYMHIFCMESLEMVSILKSQNFSILRKTIQNSEITQFQNHLNSIWLSVVHLATQLLCCNFNVQILTSLREVTMYQRLYKYIVEVLYTQINENIELDNNTEKIILHFFKLTTETYLRMHTSPYIVPASNKTTLNIEDDFLKLWRTIIRCFCTIPCCFESCFSIFDELHKLSINAIIPINKYDEFLYRHIKLVINLYMETLQVVLGYYNISDTKDTYSSCCVKDRKVAPNIINKFLKTIFQSIKVMLFAPLYVDKRYEKILKEFMSSKNLVFPNFEILMNYQYLLQKEILILLNCLSVNEKCFIYLIDYIIPFLIPIGFCYGIESPTNSKLVIYPNIELVWEIVDNLFSTYEHYQEKDQQSYSDSFILLTQYLLKLSNMCIKNEISPVIIPSAISLLWFQLQHKSKRNEISELLGNMGIDATIEQLWWPKSGTLCFPNHDQLSILELCNSIPIIQTVEVMKTRLDRIIEKYSRFFLLQSSLV
ncbi:hypothetical protein cand_020840 [Cryptosporidium andersoni]|uniref:Uncharacterized protein n=1 Tax=Cryptosporidium andersoni TaxID=117008 RepID=A0A1J4MSF1_9CRYT|nr:hypothetical protein cand_020840 [Cryptosporidium andersoni]